MSARPAIFSCWYKRKSAVAVSAPLFEPILELPSFHHARDAAKFRTAVLMNKNIQVLLERLPGLHLADWWITAGALVQSVWNVRSGRLADQGILDYDIFYFDKDLSWKAEDRVICSVFSLFSDLPITVQPRNQARVHLWYEKKFGISYPPVRSARHAIRRFPTTTTAVGITVNSAGTHLFYAPFGLTSALNKIVKPNKRLPVKTVYQDKVQRWKSIWGDLVVYPWDDDNIHGEGSDGILSDAGTYASTPLCIN